MSVLIKSMDMPDSCRHCCMMTGTFCDVLNIDVDPYYDGAKHRNVCCPLVALPEKHGDLIDKDVLKKDYKMGNDCNHCETGWRSCEYDVIYSKMDFCGWIDDTPVVIEAEGKE